MGHILENEKKEKSKVKKQVPLRLSKDLYDEIAQWAEDEFRSMNGQIEKFLSSADPDIGNVLEYRGMLYFFKYASQVGRMQLKIRSHLRNGKGSICIMISDIFHDPAAECDI